MSKHTPGPWTLGGPIGTGHLHGREPEFRVYAHRTLFLEVCADPDGYAHGENEANARLIAAAPELLEALKRMASIIDKMGDMPDGFIHPSPWQTLKCEEALTQARAAIAKAEEA